MPRVDMLAVAVPVGMSVPFTLVGVIAPSVREIAGVVVAFATEPDTPLAEVTDTDVTVPVPPHPPPCWSSWYLTPPVVP